MLSGQSKVSGSSPSNSPRSVLDLELHFRREHDGRLTFVRVEHVQGRVEALVRRADEHAALAQGVKVGDKVVDGSVAGKLEGLRQSLK